jgi:hypothetical protein
VLLRLHSFLVCVRMMASSGGHQLVCCCTETKLATIFKTVN